MCAQAIVLRRTQDYKSTEGAVPSPHPERDSMQAMLLLADRLWRGWGKIMSRARKLAIYRKADPVSEMASEVREGLETLARAVCALAVERHAKDPGHHRELAAVLYVDCMNSFHDVKIRPEMREWMAKLLNIDPRNMQKFHGG